MYCMYMYLHYKSYYYFNMISLQYIYVTYFFFLVLLLFSYNSFFLSYRLKSKNMNIYWLAVWLLPFVVSQRDRDRELEWRCPQHWVQFRSSCYRFIKSPIRPRNDARKNCQVNKIIMLLGCITKYFYK
jgi:hypothetical protein